MSAGRATEANQDSKQHREIQYLRALAGQRDTARRELDSLNADVRVSAREAHALGVPKVDIARAAGVSRPTVDKWLEEK